MMKLTVAFLATLAAADAANARQHRYARRQGYSYGDAPAVTPSAVTSAASPVVSQSSTAAVESPVVETPVVESSAAETPVVQSSAAETPVETPTGEVPAETPVGETPAETPVGETPAETPVGDVPAETPVYEVPSDTTQVSPELPSSTAGVTFPGYGGSAPVGVPSGTPSASSATEVSPELPTGSVVPGVSYSGIGSASGASPTEVAIPVPEESTSVAPVGGESSSAFPTFELTGTSGTFPTYTPSGVFPTGVAVPTGTGGEQLVTITISSTQIFTETACPQSVTDCTAKSTALVTKVVPVTTSVCPESEASSILESISSATATPTGVTDVDAVATPTPTEVVEDVTETLIQTIGTGDNAKETTYTITSKVTKTQYVTGVSEPTPGAPQPTPGAEESTTLVTEDVTSTIAKTKTLTEDAPTETGSGSNDTPSYGTPSDVPVTSENTPVSSGEGEGEDTPVSSGEGEGEGDCAVPVTVTVTVTAQETVTVTAGQGYSTGSAIPDVPSEANISVSPEQPTGTDAVPSIPTGAAPYPVNNGSAPLIPGSSGFLTQTRSSGPAPTGVSSDLPSFVLPSATPAGEAPAEETPVGETPAEETPVYTAPPAEEPTSTQVSPELPAGETPVATPVPMPTPIEEPTTSASPSALPTGSYGGGYGYGSRKRSFFGLF